LTRFRFVTGPLRVLPDFIIIGAQKSGTSSLYGCLIGHPSIPRALRKEVHFFDVNFANGMDWYRAHFPTTFYKAVTRLARPVLIGEASPYYLFHPHAAQRVAAALPAVRLIVMLRNPVDRAYSAYHHQVRNGSETLSFEAALDAEPTRLEKETAMMSADATYNSYNHRHFSYLARGVYLDQLLNWTRVFPREQILILRSEDFFADPDAGLERSLRFLGLPTWQPRRFPRYNEATYAPMAAHLRPRLVDYFAPHNRRLEAFLGYSLNWDK
jgi:hypothetical protein